MPISTKLTIQTSEFKKDINNASKTAQNALNGVSQGTQAAQRAIDNIRKDCFS